MQNHLHILRKATVTGILLFTRHCPPAGYYYKPKAKFTSIVVSNFRKMLDVSDQI
jgi:hypothetical protein